MRATLSASAELDFGDKQWTEHYTTPAVDIDRAWSDILFDRHIAKLWEAKQAGQLDILSNTRAWGIPPPNQKYAGAVCQDCGRGPVKARSRCHPCYRVFYKLNLLTFKRSEAE